MSVEALPEILVIQARIDSESAAKEQENLKTFAAATGKKLRFVNPFFPSKIDLNNPEKVTEQFEGFIILGTPDVDFSFKDIATVEGKRREVYVNTVIPVIQKVYEMEKFIHGICFGHQAMAIAAGGESIVQQIPEKKEAGTVTLRLTSDGREHPLFFGLSNQIKIVALHKDSVIALPTGFSVLGTTDNDGYSALSGYENATSTQTHPEKTSVAGLAARIEQSKESPLGGYVVTHKLEPPDNTGIIIINFLNQIKSQGDIFVSYPSPPKAA